MQPENVVEALALLLSDAGMRRRFSENADIVINELKLNAQDRRLLQSVSAQQLEIQAQLLIKKRLREVYKIVPLTMKGLGTTVFSVFAQYAVQYWPQSHRRHEQDAARFCAYLKQCQHPYNRSEWNRMRFVLRGYRYWFDFASDALVKGKKSCVLQVLYRRKHIPMELRFYLRA